MISEKKIEFLKQEGRRYIVGTPRSQLKAYQQELLEGSWEEVHEGLEVQLCPTPNGQEPFILCRSAERREKEKAMHERFEMRIEEGLRKLETACSRNRQQPLKIAERVGRLLGRNSRAAGLFTVSVEEVNGRAQLAWSKKEQWRQWAELSEGCYMLRSNVTEWTGPELWEAYIQLTEAEAAFRIQKSDLRIRPIGTRSKSGFKPTSWFAFWPTCYGKRWERCATKQAWEMSHDGFLMNLARSASSMSSCQRAMAKKSNVAA